MLERSANVLKKRRPNLDYGSTSHQDAMKAKKTFANQRVPIAKNDNVGLTGAVKRVLKRKNLSTSTIAARTRSRKKTYYTDSCPNTHKHEKENRTEKGLDIKKNC